MKYRNFGRTNWKISEVGYGMWGMGSWTGSHDEESIGPRTKVLVTIGIPSQARPYPC